MKTNEIKPYAITVFVKPKSNGISSYSSKTYKGISLATSPSKAKEMTIERLLSTIKTNIVILTRDDFTIKKCELYNDFTFAPTPD